MNKLKYIKLEQPVGDMFLVKMHASEVASISASKTRKSYNDHSGIQRKLDQYRIKNIAEFCKTKNAMFPTPIILSASSDYFVINEEEGTISIPDISEEEDKFCSIVDGQHRIEGLKESGVIDKFELLVSFVFDTDPSRDAFLFSIINGNQKPVSRSLIYDLYGLSKARTVEKTCNKVMRVLNGEDQEIDSRLSGKIKMLGYKDDFSKDGIVSQATLINNLMKLITDNSERDNIDIEFGRELANLDPRRYIFRDKFIQGDDNFIIKENIIFFNSWMKSLKKVKNLKNKSDYMLFEKTIGFSASYRILRLLHLEWKNKQTKLRLEDYSIQKEEYYSNKLKGLFEEFFNLNLDKKQYSSSESGVSNLEQDLVAILLYLEELSIDIIEEFFNEKKREKIYANLENFKERNKDLAF